MNTCTVQGCKNPSHSHGLCNMHRKRKERHGDVNWIRKHPTCSVIGCEKPNKSHGYCSAHLHRWNLYGDPLGKAPKRPKKPCRILGCDNFAIAKGFCVFHYGRYYMGKDLQSPKQHIGKYNGKSCKMGGCSEKASSLGYCKTHYRAYKVLGGRDPMKVFGSPPYTCYICGRTHDIWNNGNLHIDHVVPKSLGGSDEISNLKLACSVCNQVKTSLSLSDLLHLCKKILDHNKL